MDSNLIKEAMSGNSDAQYRLGKRYVESEPNTDKAKMWFAAASNQGHKRAKYELALILLSEDGDNTAEVCALLKESAASGDVDATLMLCRLYSDGVGIDSDVVIRCLRYCSDNGSNQCKLKLAEMLYKSDKREDRMESKVLCYELAVAGNKDAMFRLYLHYRYPLSEKTNMDLAKFWLQKAIDNGHKGALKEQATLSED